MLRKIRIALATLFYVAITALFLDFTGTLHTWLGWMAKIQFLPALLALNVGVVIVLVALTLVCGRVYCSIICPLGVMQDIFAWMGRKAKKNRYTYSPEKRWLRIVMLVLFTLSLVLGGGILAHLLAPYSAYGRIASNLLAPLYKWGNNGLAYLAERIGSYAFYETEVWIHSGITLGIAIATLAILALLAWRGGRTYCNTICPVGTVLGYIARFAWFKPVIDTEKCNSCGLCQRNCKASCINSKEKKIDYTRCVGCMDCIDACKKHGIAYKHVKAAPTTANGAEVATVDTSRRTFLTTTAAVVATSAIKAQEKKVDGGLAAIQDKIAPDRQTHLLPPGSLSARNFAQHCTACQLCVSACPNGVLTPSTDLKRLMQPEMTYERGYCRPECTKCSEVCPAGAIRPITREDKASTQIGHAVWVKKNCIPLTDGRSCGNCARHCPVGAIQMVPSDPEAQRSRRIPVIDIERCIGCGACENLCPARPFSAIYVEGHERHKIN
ncbi:MAG: 4Fe-4S dicluster domain-containing protein [Bacteroidaceae bacterium]|nr:4Fe-4S dicluster domain-containing protein [Bacteroidaceae bacterium]